MVLPQTDAPAPRPLPLLDTDVLRSFVAIAESGSFTRAAKQVFRTPSALSMQIKRLEQTLGQPLFNRDARRVHLTPAGETLLGYGRRLLALNEEAVSKFVAPAIDGTVRLGTPDDIGTRILPRVLSEFARSHPAVQVDVMTGASVAMQRRLDAGELDLILISVGHAEVAVDSGDIVHSEPLVWTGLRQGIARQRTPLPIALAEHGCAWRAAALSGLDGAGIAYRIAYNTEHCAGQRAALLADLAIGVFPKSLVQPPLVILGADDGLPVLGNAHTAMIRREAAGRASEALAGHVVAAFRDMSG